MLGQDCKLAEGPGPSYLISFLTGAHWAPALDIESNK